MSNRKTKGIKLSPINTNNGHRKKSSSISKIENNSPLPSNKTKLAPINNAIINRLSQPRKKKNRPKNFIQPCSATGKWSKPGGGRFSNARPKSDIEIKMLRAAETPGPNEYVLPSFGSGNRGVKISDANPKSAVDLIMLRSAETPGPNQYKPDQDLGDRLKGGRFSTSNPKSDLEWTIHNAKESPGPNEYDISLCPMPHISPIR
jgi:hypothetical protein